ncbi:MAG: hypothetical protein U0325_11065 [Polyangiales bacterium]
MITWSRMPRRARIGADYFAAAGVVRADVPAPQGLVPDLTALGVDPARVHPAVRAFFGDTASLTLHIESRWAWWAAWLWRLARPWFVRVGQLTTPVTRTVMRTAMVALDDAREGRPGAVGVIRTHDDGTVMQVVAYAVTGGLLSVAFPTPLGTLTGLLRLEVLAAEEGGAALALSSARSGRDRAGVYLTVGGRPWRVPLGERMALWAPSMRARPADLATTNHPRAVLVGEHVQRAFGLAMVRHRYWFVPREDA